MKNEMSITEQIGNVLCVADLLRGRYVIQQWKGGEWKRALHVNPYMSDGGLQPPGPPLYGTPTYITAADAAEVIAKRLAKWKPKAFEPDTYVDGLQWRVEQHSKSEKAWLSEKWGIAWNFTARFGKQEPHTVFDTKAEAEVEVEARNTENRHQPQLRVVPCVDDIQLTTLYAKTDSDKVLYGEYPRFGELLAKFPLLAHAGEPTADAQEVPHWVNALADDTVIDVVLDTRGDGTSDDCFVTTVGELKAACYGQMTFEENTHGFIVYTESRDQFRQIESATA